MSLPIVWTIAGSDSSGCSGVQADLKTFQYLGVHGCSIVTAVTSQNIDTFHSAQMVSKEQVRSQIETVLVNLPPKVIKIGMLGNVEIIKILTDFFQHYSGQVVLDPVLVSTSGKHLFSDNRGDYVVALKTLFPFIDILTPNLLEAGTILGRSIQSYEDIILAANELLSLGVKNVLIKGGHYSCDFFSQDYWTNGKESYWITSLRYFPGKYRGTGCTLASAIAACLALGYAIRDAIVLAKMFINQALRLADTTYAKNILVYAGWPETEMDLPYLTLQPMTTKPVAFPDCGDGVLGLYPIVDSVEWVKKLLPLGVKTIQLRIKDKRGSALEKAIQCGIQLAKQYNAKLFINDYWELAIQYNAYGVHLGQEDLASADIQYIREAGLRLGISTHCYYEVARAHAYAPSYIACGPIFHTQSKTMDFSPQGIKNLQRWRRTLNYPLVAIGGINLNNISAVRQTNVDGIAMISAITQAENFVVATKKLLASFCH